MLHGKQKEQRISCAAVSWRRQVSIEWKRQTLGLSLVNQVYERYGMATYSERGG